MSKLGVRGVSIPGILGSPLEPRHPGGIPLFEFDLGETVFTAGMAKRTSPGPFETAPIAQGDWDGTGVPDGITFLRGAQLGNSTKVLYSNIDVYQGSIVLWLTPEWDGNDGLAHWMFSDNNARIRFGKFASNNFTFYAGGTLMSVAAGAWTAGTTYCIIVRWDTKNTLDGTNSLSVAVNNAITYGGVASAPLPPDEFLWVGSAYSTFAADAIIEGFTIYRRVLYDGTYGHDVNGGLDELTAIYNAGAGVDPTTLTGSNDVVFCLPTDSAAGALVTGTGEAWSHPLPGLVDDTFMDQGNMPGGDWAVGFNGTATRIDCGSDASLDDLPSGAVITVAAWIRLATTAVGYRIIVMKGDQSAPQGWEFGVLADGTVQLLVRLATTDAEAVSDISVQDGKWHYAVGYYIDATKTARVSVDGYWGAADVGVGAYQADAGDDLVIGRRVDAASQWWNGGIAWLEISDNDRHTAGTDFPENLPTAPFNDGNTIEAWNMEEGTGANTVAMVTSPANDGTITAGTWEAVWNRELTPVEPVALEFEEENDGVDFGSGANIDDLPLADMTIEFWARIPPGITTDIEPLSKTNVGGTIGWMFYVTSITQLRCKIHHATDADVNFNNYFDSIWHHFAVDWDIGTLTARGFADGVLVDTDTAIGAYVADAAEDCLVNARGTIGTGDGAFAIGPIRISSTRRYTGASFTPPPMMDIASFWTLPDAATELQVEMRDGTGTTATDDSANGYNGTITFGATTRWLNSTDMELIEPGAQMFHSGKVYGSDQALDGIKIQLEPTNPVDGVILPRISVGQDGRARVIVDYDGTQFKYPKFHGLHTGGAAIPCEDTDGAWSQHILGWTLYNITQDTNGVPTAIDGDGQGVTGGPDFNNGDEYLWRPPNGDNYCQHPIGVYGIWVLRTAAAVVELQVVNGAGEGTIQVHQVEVQESLIDNGDMSGVFAGVPPIPPNWVNNGLDAGDTQAEGVIIHSGAQSMRWNAGATSGERITQAPTSVIGNFYAHGAWSWGDGGIRVLFTGYSFSNQGVIQNSLTNYRVFGSADSIWMVAQGVFRAIRTTAQWSAEGSPAAVAPRYLDDYYVIPMDNITLTVTPANQANSLEGTGIRVDGFDSLTQPIPVGRLSAFSGEAAWQTGQRHDDGEVASFGNVQPTVALFWGNATNFFYVAWTAANTLTVAFDAAGAGFVFANWATGGAFFVPDAGHVYRVRYTGGFMQLLVDGVIRATIVAPTGFTTIPATAYWGTGVVGDNQLDAVFSAP